MPGKLLFLLILLPLAELSLLALIGSKIGLWPILGAILGMGLLGAVLMRRQGLRTLHAIQGSLAAGSPHDEVIFDRILILIAAALFIVPGLITDGTALVLLVPAARKLIRRRWLARMQRSIIWRSTQSEGTFFTGGLWTGWNRAAHRAGAARNGGVHGARGGGGDPIDVTYTVHTPESRDLPGAARDSTKDEQ